MEMSVMARHATWIGLRAMTGRMRPSEASDIGQERQNGPAAGDAEGEQCGRPAFR